MQSHLRWITIISVIRTYHVRVGNTVKASTECRKSKIDFGGSYQGIDEIKGVQSFEHVKFCLPQLEGFLVSCHVTAMRLQL